ncbi:MAG: PH domain-containing protein [Phycisphaerales bacterium]|nr:PH domain-containing protein [Phycisphaerales bacterium]
MASFRGPSDTFIPMHLQHAVSAELSDGEQVLWQAQPIPGLYIRRSWPAVLFAIPWTAFAVFWMFGAAGFKMPTFSSGADLFPLFGIPFVLIGCGMFCSPLVLRRKARRTVYVLTDRRAIIITGLLSLDVQSFPPDQLGQIRRRQRRDGSGDLIFRTEIDYDSDGDRTRRYIGFLAIPDVKSVEHSVRDLHRITASSSA